MRILSYLILQLTIVQVLVSCASARMDSVAVDAVSKYSQLAIEKYHDNITYRENLAHSYVICYKQSRPGSLNPYPPLQFFVYAIKTDQILFEDSLSNGSIKWLNEYQFQVSTVPGIVTHDEEANKQLMGYIYDIQLKRKLSTNDIEAKYSR